MPRWLAFLALLSMLSASFGASAHSQGTTFCEAELILNGLSVVVDTPLRHLREDRVSLAQASAGVLRDVSASTPAGPCAPTVGRLGLTERSGKEMLSVPIEFACPAGAITLHNQWRMGRDEKARAYCKIAGQPWAFQVSSTDKLVGEAPNWISIGVGFFRSGVTHVLSGLDHILFVFALLLAAALMARTEGAGGALREVVRVVTGFTVGHSVTLVAGGLGWLTPDVRWVESLIAASIVAVGAGNIIRRDPKKGRMWIAAGFGLVHGLGFASFHTGLDLPAVGTVASLLSFNLGVEVGQLAVVVCVLPFLVFAAKKGWYRNAVLVPASAAVVILGAIWFVERAFEVNLVPWLG